MHQNQKLKSAIKGVKGAVASTAAAGDDYSAFFMSS
jgi:hypothetical protein